MESLYIDLIWLWFVRVILQVNSATEFYWQKRQGEIWRRQRALWRHVQDSESEEKPKRLKPVEDSGQCGRLKCDATQRLLGRRDLPTPAKKHSARCLGWRRTASDSLSSRWGRLHALLVKSQMQQICRSLQEQLRASGLPVGARLLSGVPDRSSPLTGERSLCPRRCISRKRWQIWSHEPFIKAVEWTNGGPYWRQGWCGCCNPNHKQDAI